MLWEHGFTMTELATKYARWAQSAQDGLQECRREWGAALEFAEKKLAELS